ncbi:hypothetical protein HY251_19970 [bacterium]|nr:hypothetical protein [bacterium]
MHRKTAVLVVAIAMGIGGCASASGTSSSEQKESFEKSPLLAEVLAIFPGIFVHGLGNLYAGNGDRAQELMGEEGLGLGALGVATGLGFLAAESHRHADHSHGAEEILGRIEEASGFLGVAGFAGFGAVYFFDSWIRDMIEAPGAARERNRQIKRAYDESPAKAADPNAATITSATTPSPPRTPPAPPEGSR